MVQTFDEREQISSGNEGTHLTSTKKRNIAQSITERAVSHTVASVNTAHADRMRTETKQELIRRPISHNAEYRVRAGGRLKDLQLATRVYHTAMRLVTTTAI